MDKILKQFGEEKIIEVVKNSNSFVEATLLLELDSKNTNVKKNVERSIKRLGLSTEHFESVKRLKDSRNRYTKEKLEFLVKKCKNYKDILEELDVLPLTNNYEKLKFKLTEYKIDFEHLKCKKHITFNWSNEILEPIVKKSKSKIEILKNLGLRVAGSNYSTLNKYLKKYNLNISHFIIHDNSLSKHKIPLDSILVENSSYSRTDLKKRLYSTGLKKRNCELCGQGEEWNGKHMSLILDHKNGVYNDNKIENLRIVCPNCNATLDTHAGKNIKKKIKPEKVKENLRLDYNISRRKVERPSFDILKNEITLLGFEATGRKYNVTGNSIKKWIKTYEKYGI